MKIDRKENYRKLLNMAMAYWSYQMSCDMATVVESKDDDYIANESLEYRNDCKWYSARADMFPVSKGVDICKSIFDDCKGLEKFIVVLGKRHNAIAITRDYLEGKFSVRKYRYLIHEYEEYEQPLTSADIRQIFVGLRQLRDYLRKFEPNF